MEERKEPGWLEVGMLWQKWGQWPKVPSGRDHQPGSSPCGTCCNMVIGSRQAVGPSSVWERVLVETEMRCFDMCCLLHPGLLFGGFCAALPPVCSLPSEAEQHSGKEKAKGLSLNPALQFCTCVTWANCLTSLWLSFLIHKMMLPSVLNLLAPMWVLNELIHVKHLG